MRRGKQLMGYINDNGCDKNVDWLERTRTLIGEKAVERLRNSSIVIFGIGGVGSFATEAIARLGVENLILVDFDKVSHSNINRQLVALNSTVGQYKVDVMAQRINDINPLCKVKVIKEFVSIENINSMLNEKIDFVVDAIDSVTSKLDVIETSINMGIPIVSSMGAGNKMDPSKFQVKDISKTHTCPLARAVRVGLRKRNIYKGVEVVFSTELPIHTDTTFPSSISFVPSAAGLLLASVVANKLLYAL